MTDFPGSIKAKNFIHQAESEFEIKTDSQPITQSSAGIADVADAIVPFAHNQDALFSDQQSDISAGQESKPPEAAKNQPVWGIQLARIVPTVINVVREQENEFTIDNGAVQEVQDSGDVEQANKLETDK